MKCMNLSVSEEKKKQVYACYWEDNYFSRVKYVCPLINKKDKES